MWDFLGFGLARGIIVFVGQVIRYFFYRCLGSGRSFESYSNRYKDDYNDMGEAMNQEISSLLVGLSFLFLVIFILANI